jgi:hypothetical protein
MLETLGLIAGSGWAAGLNIYLVTLILGLGGRAGWADVPMVLQRTDVLIVSGVLYLIEFAADRFLTSTTSGTRYTLQSDPWERQPSAT